MLEKEKQFYLARLSAWNGYHRQDALEKLADCYDTILFPMLLRRLSDYVAINRERAAQHIVRWAEYSDFSDLCVQYFEDIAHTQKRIRIVNEVEDLLLEKTAKNMAAIQEVFFKQQGQRPRLLLKYIQRYEWLDQPTLLLWCERAKDQRVREYWLNDLIRQDHLDPLKNAFYSTSYRHVKMRLLPILYEKNAFSIEDYLLLLQQPSFSIMDFAVFALKKQQFDFMAYFNAHPFADLAVQDQVLRLYQWVLLTLPELQFKHMVRQLSSQNLQVSVLTFARNQNYLSSMTYLQCYVDLMGKLNLDILKQFNQKERHRLSVYDLVTLCRTLGHSFSFLELMTLAVDYGYWDQFLWLILHHQDVITPEDQQYFIEHLLFYTQEGQYQYYTPSWNAADKQHLMTLLKYHHVDFQHNALIKAVEHLKKILQK